LHDLARLPAARGPQAASASADARKTPGLAPLTA